MAVAVVQQHQQPTDKIIIDLANSKVVVNKDNKETPSNKKVEKKAATVGNTDNNTETKNTSQKNSKDTSKKAIKSKIKREVAAQKPVMETIQLPIPKQTMFFSFAVSPYDLNGYASKVNKNLYEYERVKSNQSSAMEEAIRLHNGDPSNTCVFFQSACLRAIGQPVPNNIAYTSVLWNWLENNNWEIHRDFENIQKGDLIFAGKYHTMCFMGWKDKARGIAYVMGNEAYREGNSYSNRNMNGQKEAEENGWNNQFRATRYYKYKGTQIKGDSNSDITNMSNVTYNSAYHKFTVTPLKGDLTAKQDVYINEKPYPTYEEVTPIGLAHGGEKFKVTGKTSNGWFEITYEDKKGYINSKYTNFIEDKTISKDTTIKPTENSKPSESIMKTSYIEANGGLWLHSTMSSSISSRLNIMNKNSKVIILEENGSWCKVNYNGKIGWCASKYLSSPKAIITPSTKPVEPSKPAIKPVVKVTNPNKQVETTKPSKPSEPTIRTAHIKANGGLWLHSTMDSSLSSRLTIMKNGENVEILDQDGSWFKVNYNGNIGWCSGKFLSEPVKNTSTKENKPANEIKTSKPANTNNISSESSEKIAYVKAYGGLWLHSTMSSSTSSRMTIMGNGNKVTVLSENGSWFKVNYNGNIGWCAKEFLTTPKTSQIKINTPDPTKKTDFKIASVKADGGLWLHSNQSTSALSRITIMGRGDNVKILGQSGPWYKVDYNGHIGWCSSKFIV